MGRAMAIALVLAVAALATVSAQSPQVAKPFLATQYATVSPARPCVPVSACSGTALLRKLSGVELCGMLGGSAYALESALCRDDGDPCALGLGLCRLCTAPSLLLPAYAKCTT